MNCGGCHDDDVPDRTMALYNYRNIISCNCNYNVLHTIYTTYTCEINKNENTIHDG